MTPNDRHTIFITGAAGFIGSNLVLHFLEHYPEYTIVGIDALTYAGNLANLEPALANPNFSFKRFNVNDAQAIDILFATYKPNGIIHLAAESHVDRSITDPFLFERTNIQGTLTLLNTARKHWQDDLDQKRFYHVSTDEVYGTLEVDAPPFTEQTPYAPRSPYSASKAAADHYTQAYFHTYGLPTLISNCSNNYGAFQFPEKLIPLCITNIIARRPLPIYGQGLNIRDWVWVGDHIRAIDRIYHQGTPGQSYNIGGHSECSNIDLVHQLIALVDARLERPHGESEALIAYVQDRAGHDFRYAIDTTKIERELGWRPIMSLSEGLALTVDWYVKNTKWLDNLASGEYLKFYTRHFGVKP